MGIVRGLAVGVAVLLLAGCSSSDAAVEPATASARTYAVFPTGVPAAGWQINTAGRNDDPASRENMMVVEAGPSVGWTAEYADFGRGERLDNAFVVAIGYHLPLAEVTFADDAELTGGTIGSRPGTWGVRPDDPEEGKLVAVSLSPTETVALEGYNVSVEQLRDIAATLVPATVGEWEQAHRRAL